MITEKEIIDIVCRVCGIEQPQLMIRSRKEPLPTARALISHFLSTELRMSPRQIKPLISGPGYGRTSIYHYLRGQSLVEQRSPYQSNLNRKARLIRQIIHSVSGANSGAVQSDGRL